MDTINNCCEPACTLHLKQVPAGAERIAGLTWRPVAAPGDVAGALAQGQAARATGATAMNDASSRSHALLAVRLAPAAPGGAATTLHLVDLAGAPPFDSLGLQARMSASDVHA